MFSQKNKSEYVLEFTRTLPKSKKNVTSLYLFPPGEAEHLPELLDRTEWNARPIDFRYRVLGIPEDKKQHAEQSVSLLSPHYETLRSTWLASFQRSLEKVQYQIQQAGLGEQQVGRLLLLLRGFAKRIRTNVSSEPRQSRYQRQLDVYFSWLAEQSLLALIKNEGWADLPETAQAELKAYYHEEIEYRKAQGYLKELDSRSARIFYRMQLYRRFLDRYILLKPDVIELGNIARRSVKAFITTLIMSAFTIFIFYYRDSGYSLSIGLILTVAMVYALRDLLRDDLVKVLTDYIRKDKALWKLRYRKNKKSPLLFQQFLWRSIISFEQLPESVKKNSGKWFFSAGNNIFFFRSEIDGDGYLGIEENIEESIEIDFKPFADLLSSVKTPIYHYDFNDEEAEVGTHLIEQRHYYNLVLVTEDSQAEEPVKVQRWKLTLTAEGIVNTLVGRVIEPSKA
ncbi:hypothetical protein [Marinospirillum insulare]|uniref:Uncharacterized protein n=1 Tax=Marinospirillum insulare TaxID=217169 RepID=A0ABQ6A3B1_9GAMM|nr:hypothetical protein [Marinospirillum insulare]GLR64565.1 hypothetical protein GCM10007878_20030 [Marinospirillum insulare]